MRCGWDLADLYRDRMSLRELWVRVQALPHDAPLWTVQAAAVEKAKAEKRSADIDDALNRYKQKG